MAKGDSNGKRSGKTSKRAAGYIRMSSPQQETSPEQQRREIIELAKRKGYDIVCWYVDRGISGDEIEKRPDFRQMLQDAQDGQFDVILCWDQDRFGRFDSLKAGWVIEPLRMRGVRLVTVTQGEIDWNDFAGRMMYAIQQEGKNQFLHSLSQNVLRGLLQSAKDGYRVGTTPYGYDRVFYDAAGNQVHRVRGGEKFSKPKNWKTKIEISENIEEVETVKYIFDRFANTNASMRRICAELRQKGIRTRTGGEWGYQSLRVLLRNPAYIGTMIYGKSKQGRFNWVGNGTIGGDEPLVFENAHPAIIDQKTFEEAQKKMADNNAPLRRSRDNDYVLSGLVVCGITGQHMWGRQTTWGQKLRYYTSYKLKSDGSDSCFSIRKDHFEEFVLGKMVELINQPELRDHIRKGVMKRFKRRKKNGPDLKKLQKQLADLDAKIERATERILLVDTDALDDAHRLLATWRNERRRVAVEIAEATKDASSDLDAQVDAVMAQLANLKDAIDLADPTELKAALRATIQDITLYWGPGGPRKWRLYRGVIRLREPLLFKETSTRRFIPTKPTPTPGNFGSRERIWSMTTWAFLMTPGPRWAVRPPDH
jgi:site-specific DNA recombinase